MQRRRNRTIRFTALLLYRLSSCFFSIYAFSCCTFVDVIVIETIRNQCKARCQHLYKCFEVSMFQNISVFYYIALFLFFCKVLRAKYSMTTYISYVSISRSKMLRLAFFKKWGHRMRQMCFQLPPPHSSLH